MTSCGYSPDETENVSTIQHELFSPNLPGYEDMELTIGTYLIKGAKDMTFQEIIEASQKHADQFDSFKGVAYFAYYIDPDGANFEVGTHQETIRAFKKLKPLIGFSRGIIGGLQTIHKLDMDQISQKQIDEYSETLSQN